MTLKQVFKRILTVILWILLYTIILTLLVVARESFIDWKANTFDLDGDGFLGGIEDTKEQYWWWNLRASDARNILLIFLIPLGSGLLTAITASIIFIIKRIKKRHMGKIAIFSALLYFLILNLLVIINEANEINSNAFIAGVTNEWEYWVLQSLFFSPRLLLISEILTLITIIIILVIEIVKIKRVTHGNGKATLRTKV